MEKYPNVVGGSPSDLNIPLVVKGNYESHDYGIIIFEKPQGFTFEPGNWMDIRFLTPALSTGKTYSFASSPTEHDLVIVFKKGVSKFKKALGQIQIGETMLITQFGSNGFLLNKKYKSLFIAGGIGITPFRSMIKEAIDTNSKAEITLIYQNHTDEFPFKNELDEWEQTYPYLKIHYIVTEKEERLTKEKLMQLIPDITKYMSYIAGSPGMVTNIESLLVSLGIRNEDIKIDSFNGY